MMHQLCLHLANVLYLGSFVSRDMLWLRVLTCVGLTLGMVYFSSCAQPMYGPASWHAVFLLINFYQIRMLMIERRETDLTDAREIVGEAGLEDLSRDELVDLLTHELSGRLDRRQDPKEASKLMLDEDELVLKRLVLERLSRKEIVNLLTRRMWKPIKRRFKRRAKQNQIASEQLRERIAGMSETQLES